MKQFLVTVAATALVWNVTAQSLEEGKKMYRYERYESAKNILKPLAANNAEANYYYGMALLETGKLDEALTAFVKYPEDWANIGGTVRVKFAKEGEQAGMQAAQNLADMGKRKDHENKRYAADAINYAKGGNKQLAVDWYNEVLEKESTPEILVATGDAYLQLSSGGGEAMNHYEKAVAKDPGNSLAYSRMGKLMYSARNYDEALKHWAKAKEADPANPLPYRDMAEAYTYVGQYKVAKENIDKYYELSDKNLEDRIRYAEIMYLAKEYDKAIEKINELKSEGVDRSNFDGILAFSYLEKKDSISGVMALQNARVYFAKQEKEKLTKDAYMKYGQIYLRNNKADSANWAFSKALEKEAPENKAVAYREIAESYRLGRDWVNGAKWYEKIIIEFPDEAKGNDYYWCGICYYYSSSNSENVDAETQLSKATATFDKMVEKFPDEHLGYYYRGRSKAALDSEGKEGLAVEDFEKWLSMDLSKEANIDRLMPYALQYLTAAYYHKEDKEKALMYANRVLEKDPDNAFAEQIKEYFEQKQ